MKINKIPSISEFLFNILSLIKQSNAKKYPSLNNLILSQFKSGYQE